ncbi:DnaJ-like protein MG200 [compost metagenome]
MNHYDTLGVDRRADADAIKKAFRKAASRAHPDRKDTGGSTERMQAVNAAWAVLGDPARRADYDAGGTGAEAQDPLAEARSVLASLFAQVLEASPDGTDPIANLHKELKQNKVDADQTLRQANKQAARMRAKAERIKTKGADNFLRQVAESLAVRAEGTKEAALKKLALVRQVSELLGEYSYEMSEAEKEAMASPWGMRPSDADLMSFFQEAMKGGRGGMFGSSHEFGGFDPGGPRRKPEDDFGKRGDPRRTSVDGRDAIDETDADAKKREDAKKAAKPYYRKERFG